MGERPAFKSDRLPRICAAECRSMYWQSLFGCRIRNYHEGLHQRVYAGFMAEKCHQKGPVRGNDAFINDTVGYHKPAQEQQPQ